MKRNLVLVVLILLSAVVLTTGCDQIKQMLGIAPPQPAGPGAVGPGPETMPGQPGPGPGFRSLNCCVISNFQVGIVRFDNAGNFAGITETTTVPYAPGSYFGVYFEYLSKVGKPIQYREEEFFPYPPQNWSLWEGSEGSYRTFPDESRAEYTTVLTPGPAASPFLSHWAFNPSGDPTGQWRWDIYFDNEFYTSVVFNVVPATY
ncbi:MAG: hypothetical protein JW765_06770 [Deltaproteobacteria bacterium]|nr:hypothetical protein [Candidatus Zymogenaceae bacterium]